MQPKTKKAALLAGGGLVAAGVLILPGCVAESSPIRDPATTPTPSASSNATALYGPAEPIQAQEPNSNVRSGEEEFVDVYGPAEPFDEPTDD